MRFGLVDAKPRNIITIKFLDSNTRTLSLQNAHESARASISHRVAAAVAGFEAVSARDVERVRA